MGGSKLILALISVFGASSEYTEADSTGPWTVLSGDSIAALPLKALDYQLYSQETLANGVKMENGTFATGSFSTLNSKNLPQAEQLRATTVLFSPTDWNRSSGAFVGLVAGIDNDAHLISELAADLAMPILLAGYGHDIPHLYGYQGMNQLNAISWTAMEYQHPCNISNASELLWGNFEYQLAKKDMLAITLLQHLTAVTLARGRSVGSLEASQDSHVTPPFTSPSIAVALIGSSKGGGAAWIAAAADQRVRVVAPEHNQAENISNYLDSVESSWGCKSACHAGGSGTGQNGTQLMIFRKWMQTTPAGRTALALLSPHAFYAQAPSKPEFIVGSGGTRRA
jgi:hypothetical protein